MHTAHPALTVSLRHVGALALSIGLAACTAEDKSAGATPKAAAEPACVAASAPPPSCSWHTQDSPADCKGLCVSGNLPFEVTDDGTGSTTMQLCNRSDAPIRPGLGLTPFKQVFPTTRTPIAAAVQWRAASASQEAIVKGQAELAPTVCVAVTLEASRLREAGLMAATLQHEGKALVEIKALRERPKFQLKGTGTSPDKITLAFVHQAEGSTARIVLRNEDAMTYRFHWQLELEGEVVGEGTATAYPGREVAWPVRLPAARFSIAETALIRVGEQHGRLLLTHEPDPDFQARGVAQKSFDVTARLAMFGRVWQGIVNSVVIVLLLVLGIGLSLLVNYVLPVQRKRIALKQRLADLEGKLAGLGGVLSSRRLNLLRTEKKRLRDELRANQWYHPSTDAVLPKLEARIDRLGQRIGLTVEAGAQLIALRDDATIALTEAERVHGHCRTALEVAEKPEPDEADLKAARAALDAAASIRAKSDEPPSAEALSELKAQAGALRVERAPAAAEPDKLAAMQQTLQKQLPGADMDTKAGAMTRDAYLIASAAVCKLSLLRDFANAVGESDDTDLQNERKARAADLLAALQPGADASLRRAAEIVAEVRENVDKKALLAAVEKSGAVHIEIDPRTPVPYQLVMFRLTLARPGLDAARARRQIPCRWTISGPGIDAGAASDPDESWAIGRFFEPPAQAGMLSRWWHRWFELPLPETAGPFCIKATLHADRNDPKAFVETTVELRLEPVKSYGADIAVLTMGTTIVTLCLLALGLVSGAEEKIRSLDWWPAMVAVVAIGFGADALKRVLTKP